MNCCSFDVNTFFFYIQLFFNQAVQRHYKSISIDIHVSKLERGLYSGGILIAGRPSIKSGTWNIPEHSATFRNIPEHSGTFRNIPEYSRTSNNYDNYEKNMLELNFLK